MSDFGRAETIKFYRLVDVCISDEGFHLKFSYSVPPEYVLRNRKVPAYGSLRKYGFGTILPDGIPPGIAYLEGLAPLIEDNSPEYGDVSRDGVTRVEANATLKAYNLCVLPLTNRYDDSTGRPRGALGLSYDEFTLFIRGFTELRAEADSEPAVLEAFGEFRQGVTDRGWPLRLTTDEGIEIKELKIAADYADCMAPVEKVRLPLRAAIRDKYIDEHFAELFELEGWFRLRQAGTDTE